MGNPVHSLTSIEDSENQTDINTCTITEMTYIYDEYEPEMILTLNNDLRLLCKWYSGFFYAGQTVRVSFDQLKKHDYQLGIGSWFADFRDPISFLEIFKLKNNGTNNTQWEHPNYIAMIEKSSQTADPRQRNVQLKEAEKLLIQEMPIIPLFYSSYNYVKSPNVKEVYFSELGYLDFKNAYVE